MCIRRFRGFGAVTFGDAPLVGSAFSIRQIGRLPTFRADASGAPFGGGSLSRAFSRAGVSSGDETWGKGEDDEKM